MLKDQINENKFFDDFLYLSINNKIFPVAEYNDKGLFEANLPMIGRVEKIVENSELATAINDAPAIQDNKTGEVNEVIPNESLATKIVDVLKDPFSFSLVNDNRRNLVEPVGQVQKEKPAPDNKPLTIKANLDDNDDINIELDGKTLTKVMKYYKVSNPDIIANTKAAIDSYIKDTGTVPTKENAEKLVLKAVNKSIHGTDTIDDKYLSNPSLLFNKLKNIDVFSVPLEFPKNKERTPFTVSDVVTLKNVTGQHRQKYEFSDVIHENVEKVFKTLEQQPIHPIKFLGMTHDYVDTDSDRYTEYTIDLKNMDGNKQKYQVKLDIPCPVNDKYFKIGGNTYIFANQQHMKPLTKTDKNDVRFLTNYAIIRLSTENLKFNVSDINDILTYVQQRYPGIIESADDHEVLFKDGDKIYLTGDNVYDGITSIVIYNEDGKLVDKKGLIKFKNNNRFEFLYDLLVGKIQLINPDDELTKSKKSIPYIALYMSGVKIPFIIFMWHEKGLLSTLNQFGINYTLSDTPGQSGDIFLETTEKKYLTLLPDTIREKLIVNGLLVNKIKYPLKNLDDPKEIDQHITEIYGTRTIFLIDNLVSNIIDPITKELLVFENYPTNLPGLLSGPALNMLLNQKPDSLTDLKIYRTRMSEIVLRILYRQLTRAASSYAHKVEFGDPNARLMLVQEYVINEFLNRNPPDQSVEKNAGAVLNLTQSVNPIDEIMLASKVIKTGPGGLRSRNEFTPSHRNVHPSQIGNMSALSTPESADVGIVTHHTLSPLVLNKYGSYGLKDPKALSGWNAVSMTEALTPLIQEIYADRATLAVTHSRQVTPVNNSEPPYVITGAEYIVPQIASTRFVHKAKADGIVEQVIPNETMTVKYSNGKKETLDILPRKSQTRRGAFISLEMIPLGAGTKFKKNDILAGTKNFSDKDNMYVSGRNVTIAVMNYMGYNYEDAYVISDKIAETTTTDTLKEVFVVIPPETKVFKLEKQLGKETKPGDNLIEFAYDEDINSYMTANEFELDSDDVETILGSNNSSIFLKSPGGKIVDIKVYINDKIKSDPQLIQFHKELVKRTEDIEAQLRTGKSTKYDQLAASDNIEKKFFQIGGHKQKGVEFKGIKVSYLIKQPKPLRIGDKIN